MHVHLREADLDAGSGEALDDGLVEVVGDADAVGQFGHVGAQLEVDGAVGQGDEGGDGGGIVHDARMRAGDFEQEAVHAAEVGIVGDAHGQHDAGDRVAQGPVDDLAGDEGLVGDDDFLVVVVAHGGGTGADARDGAVEVADGDGVVDAEGALDQQDEAGDEVGKDFLHAEAEPDREGRREPLQLRPAQAELAEAEQAARDDDGIAQQRGDGVAGGG